MINAPYEKEFVFHDGKHAKNIMELCEILEKLPESEFSQFVNSYKNDFANWAEAVLSEAKLAEKLRTTISKDQSITFIRARLREISLEQYSLNITGANVLKLSEPVTIKRQDTWHDENRREDRNKHSDHEPKHNDTQANDEHHVHHEHHENKWYDFFKSSDLSKKNIRKNVIEESDKHRAEAELKEQEKDYSSENIFWIILYGLLIGLIIVLLVYQLVFKG